jgi:hypothetical protein
MKKTWGRLLLTEIATVVLVGGCQPPPPETPPAPPPPPPPPVVEAPPVRPGDMPDPPGAASGLGALSPLFAEQKAGTRAIKENEQVTFGKGLVAYVDLQDSRMHGGEPACPVQGFTREDCRFLRVAPFAQPVPMGTWRLGRSAGAGAWSALVPARHRWGSLSPGQDVVYAVRRDGSLTIDTINEKGEESAFLDSTSLPVLRSVDVLELKDTLQVVAVDENGQLAVVPVSRGAAPKAGALNELKISVSDPDDGANQARYRISQGMKVMYGSWVSSPLLDKQGSVDGHWLLAWVEAIPPPKYTPAGVPFKGKGGRATKAKHGCGRGSRPLFDASVEKKTHLMRMSPAGKVVEEKIIAPPPGEYRENSGVASALAVQPFPGGFELGGQRYTNELGAFSGEPPQTTPPAGGALPRPPFEATVGPSIVAAAYDVPSGEGIVIGQQDETYVAQLFNAIGEGVGAPFKIPGKFQFAERSIPTLARVGGSWVALEDNHHGIRVLNGEGDRAGQRIELNGQSGFPLGLVRADDSNVQLIMSSWSGMRELTVYNIDVPNRTLTTATQGSSRVLLSTEVPTHVAQITPGAITILGARPNETPVIGQLDASGRWQETSLKLGDQVGTPKKAHVHPVWGDAVVVVEGDKGSMAFWAKAGGSAPLAALGPVAAEATKKPSHPNDNDIHHEYGPFVHGGAFLLPPTPGDVAATGGDLARTLANCPYALPTGPKRTVLVCAEPIDATSLGTRVGLRVYRP